VHPIRLATASRTTPRHRPWIRPDPHRPTDLLNPLDYHIRQVRKKNLNNIMITTRSIMITPM
jgi:hypothetical protein